MNKLKLALVGVGLAAMVGASAPAAAVDSSVTVLYRGPAKVIGLNPSFGVLRARLVTPTAGISISLPIPAGKTSADIAEYDAGVFTSAGVGPKPATYTLVGGTLGVSGSNMTSGTLSNGDILKARVYYK